jgi:diacylglycerol kinase (ATP)
MDRVTTSLPLINERLRTIVRDLDITLTASADDAERAAARAADDGCDALYVAGGDGTLNAVLRGLAARDALRAMPIGVIPFGTGNDFVKALDVGDQPDLALEALVASRVIDVDIGMLNDRPFANTSAGGFIADVSEQVTESLKDVTGKLAYLIGGAKALFGTAPFTARLIINDARHGGEAARALDMQMFVASNARFIGGGYEIAPRALIDDGLLDVLVVPRMSMLDFVGVLQGLAAGDVRHPEVLHFRGASFDLEFDRAVHVNADGELLEASCCRYRVLPAAARFFCGPNPHARQQPRAFAAPDG